MEQKKVKLAQVGTGYWGVNILKSLYSLKDGLLDTICDINQKVLDDLKLLYPEVNMVIDFNLVLLNPEITAVFIALPAEMHYSFGKRVLEAGKDLYIEKPITLNVDEAEDLLRLSRENNCILMVGHLLNYHPAIEKIKEIIKSDRIGKIKNIVSNRLNLGIFRVQESVMWSFGCHDISVILSLCGNKLPESVNCFGQSNITPGIHDITNTVFQIDDIYVNINLNWLNPFKEQKMTIICERGMLLFDDMEPINKLKLYENYITACARSLVNQSFTRHTLEKSIPVANKTIGQNISLDLSETPLIRECRHFVECCRTRKKPLTDGEEAIRVLKVLHMCSDKLKPEMVPKMVLDESKLDYYVHESSIVDSGANIGTSTQIWHWSHITSSAEIGERCNIGQAAFISGKLGNGCKVQNNVSVYLGVECGDNVFLGPSCVFTNDLNPRAAHPKHGEYVKTYIEEGSTIGANATIRCGIRIGKHSLIGAGSVVVKDVEEYAIMVGNPARQIGTIDEYGNRTIFK